MIKVIPRILQRTGTAQVSLKITRVVCMTDYSIIYD